MYGKDKWKEKPIDDLPFQYNMDLNLLACCTSKYGNNSELMIVSYVENLTERQLGIKCTILVDLTVDSNNILRK